MINLIIIFVLFAVQNVCFAPVVMAEESISSTCSELVTAHPPDPNSGCCGKDSFISARRIFGGDETYISEYPWLVLIGYSSEDIERTCGGSLISARYVLTAGHCMKRDELFGITPTHVILGEYDTSNEGPDCIIEEGGKECNEGSIKIDIEKKILHPDGKDIALVRLKEMAPFTSFIRPICLPTTDVTASPPDDFKLVVAGWGLTQDGIRSKIKLKVEVPLVNHAQCVDAHVSTWKQNCSGMENTPDCQSLYEDITQDHVICAGGVIGKSSCKGDSGGPLMHVAGPTIELVGVVAFGAKACGKSDLPAYYIKVFDFVEWINSSIEP